jgi:hypothetical protein
VRSDEFSTAILAPKERTNLSGTRLKNRIIYYTSNLASTRGDMAFKQEILARAKHCNFSVNEGNRFVSLILYSFLTWMLKLQCFPQNCGDDQLNLRASYRQRLPTHYAWCLNGNQSTLVLSFYAKIAVLGTVTQSLGKLQRGSQSLVPTHDSRCASRRRSSSLTLKLQC